MTPSCGLVGHPLGHSMSPYIHRRLFALQGRQADYALWDIPPQALPGELPLLLKNAGGLNVTIPYKQAVIPFLNRLEGRAALYQSVNTVAVEEEAGAAVYIGHNTDAAGFRRSLEAAGIPLAGRVLLLGCGGVGRTFACEAALSRCTVVNAVRPSSRQRAEALRRDVLKLAPDTAYDIVDIGDIPGEYDLLINGTPVGMTPHREECPAPPAVLGRTAAVFDAIYNPGRTRLLREAEAAGARVLGGMAMLVWQAAEAQRIWYGASFSPDDIDALCADAEEELRRLFPA